MKRTVLIMLAGVVVTAAATASILLGTPERAQAAQGCTVADARGTYGFQFFGFAPGPTGDLVPFAESGRLVVDPQGNVSGASTFSVGGSVFTHTFNGTVSIQPDCTGQSSVVESAFGLTLNTVWVIVKPGEQILLTSLTGGAVNGRAERMSPKAQ